MNDLYFEGTLDAELVRVHHLPTGRLSIRRKADGEELWSGDPANVRCDVSGYREEGSFVYFAAIGEYTIALEPGDTTQARKVVRAAQGTTGSLGTEAGSTGVPQRVPSEVARLERIAGVVSIGAYVVGISGICIGFWLALQSNEVEAVVGTEKKDSYVWPGIGVAVAALVQAIFIEFAATWAKAWASVQRTAR